MDCKHHYSDGLLDKCLLKEQRLSLLISYGAISSLTVVHLFGDTYRSGIMLAPIELGVFPGNHLIT